MKYVLIAGVAIIAIFLLVLHFIPLGIEPLTEVYFENHTKLPVNVFLNSTYDFAFTVHNLEYQTMNYTYDVDVQYGNMSGTLSTGEFTLENNVSITLSKPFRFSEHFDRAQITIIVNKNTTDVPPVVKGKLWWKDPNYPTSIDIHFWVDEYVPATAVVIKDNATNTTNTTNRSL